MFADLLFVPPSAWNATNPWALAGNWRESIYRLPDLPVPVWKGTAPRNIGLRYLATVPLVFIDEMIRCLALVPRRYRRRKRAIRHGAYLLNFYKEA